MPVKELVAAMDGGINPVPADVKRVAEGLVYRDFITVGLLLDKLLIKNPAKKGTPESKLKFVADNWIYVQESDVKLGRIQIFNNWSPYLVADPEKVWIGHRRGKAGRCAGFRGVPYQEGVPRLLWHLWRVQ